MNERSQRTIGENIRALRARWLRVRFARHALQSLFYLLLLSSVVLLIFPELPLGAASLTLLAAAALTGGLLSLIGRPTEAALAKDYDDVAGLKDRVSSSIELMDRRGPMVEALIEEAASVTRRLTPRRVYPYHVPREGRWLAVPAMLVAAVLLLPALVQGEQGPDPAVAETIEARIAQLEEILSEEKNKELSERRKELLEELEKLQASLSGEKVDKKDAMAEIAKMLEQLEAEQKLEEQKKLDLKKMLAGLKEKNKDLEELLERGDYQDALNKLKEKLDELEKELKRKKKEGATPEELEKLEEMIRKMKEIEAQLLKLLQINSDLKFSGEVIDFLKFFEGDLADVQDWDGGFLVPCDCEDPFT